MSERALPMRSLTVPWPMALRSWYVWDSLPMVPAFLLCLEPLRTQRICSGSAAVTLSGLQIRSPKLRARDEAAETQTLTPC